LNEEHDPVAGSPRQGTEASEQQPKGNRRRFFGLAGAAVAGLLTGRLTQDEAQAASGDPLLAGQTTTALTKTELLTAGPIANDGAFVVDAPNADYGVFGTAGSIGVYGKGPIGVLGTGAVGGVFSGTDTALSLTPTGTSGPSTTESLKGDVLVDADGVLWLCIDNGTPGTWIAVSHGGVRMLPSPWRVWSSTDVGDGSKLSGGEIRDIQIVGAVPGVPAPARAIVGNLTIHRTDGGGYLTAFPAGTPRPFTSSINWDSPGKTVANAITVGLGASGAISLFADVSPGGPATHAIVDVAGYVL
jgi:hypothetical protein